MPRPKKTRPAFADEEKAKAANVVTIARSVINNPRGQINWGLNSTAQQLQYSTLLKELADLVEQAYLL